MRGLKRGLAGGLLLALITFFLPDGVLGALTVGTGLASVVPAAAPPLGTTARLLLASVALVIGFALTFWLVRRSRPSWDVDDGSEAEPLPAYQQMVVSPAGLSAGAGESTAPPPAPPPAGRDLDARLTRIEAAIADVPAQIARATAGGAPDQEAAALLTRVAALETQIGERLAAIEARLAAGGVAAADPALRPRRVSPRVGGALDNIRRSLDGADGR
jgi:hypothetical protein